MPRVRQWLAGADEANLVLDRHGQVNVFLLAGTLRPGGFVDSDGVADIDELRRVIHARAVQQPELCRRVSRVGGRHRWVPATVVPEHHIRLVPGVGGLEGLRRLCGDLMTQSLPRDRPMWELLVVPGVVEGGVGIVLRIHHALADGMQAVSIAGRLFDPSARQLPPPRLAPSALSEGESRRPGHRLNRMLVGLRRMATTLHSGNVAPTLLLGERSPHRGVAFAEADLAALRAGVHLREATVNDAVLAAAASGFRAALRAGGETIPESLPVSVPVALRRHGGAANQVGVMVVSLPLAEPDPDRRLRIIAEQARAEKTSARRQGTLEFMRGPWGARIVNRLARRQRLVAGFVTNVPGPEVELLLAGARVVDLWPVAVLAGNVRVGVAALSYNGTLRCGIHFDARHVPGGAFADEFARELSRLT